MTIYDISVTVTPDMVTWENAERGCSLEWACRIGPDSPCNVSILTVGMHAGTHLDAPLHFLEDGGAVESLDLNVLVGPAQLVEVYGAPKITAADCERAGIPPGTERVLFKTDNTAKGWLHDPQFHEDYVGVGADAAQWLVDHGVRLVGVDYLSVGPFGAENIETHRTLLGAGVVAVEALNLADVAAGRYTFAALPPKIAGAEGCPCRAILMKD